MSSLLFNTVLQYSLKEEIQRWQKKKGMGIYLSDHDRDCVTNLRFADDVMLFATSKRTDTESDASIQEGQPRKWDSGFTQTRRRFSATRAPSIRTQKKHIEVGDMSIEILTRNDSVKYLGQRISTNKKQ